MDTVWPKHRSISHSFGLLKLDPMLNDLIVESVVLARKMFSLSESEKNKLVSADFPLTRGYSPIGKERFYSSATPDHKEFFSWGKDEFEANIWPTPVLGIQKMFEATYDAIHELANRLLCELGDNMGFDLEKVNASIADANSLARVIRYPRDRAHISGEHRDLTLISLIFSSSISGLEVKKNGYWTNVHLPPGHCFLMAGEMLEILSGGKIEAVSHRVVTKIEGDLPERVSIAFFLYPNGNYQIVSGGFLPGAQSNDHKTAAQFLRQRVSEIGLSGV